MEGFTHRRRRSCSRVIVLSAILAYARGLVREIAVDRRLDRRRARRLLPSPRCVEPLMREVPVLRDVIGTSCELGILAGFAVGLRGRADPRLALHAAARRRGARTRRSARSTRASASLFGIARGVLLVVIALVVYNRVFGGAGGVAADRRQPQRRDLRRPRGARSPRCCPRTRRSGSAIGAATTVELDCQSCSRRQVTTPRPRLYIAAAGHPPRHRCRLPRIPSTTTSCARNAASSASSASQDAANFVALGLHALQHRGQEAAGIVAYAPETGFSSARRFGYVRDNFTSPSLMETLPGPLAIGHVRYSTAGSKGNTQIRDVQPLFAEFAMGGCAIAHNGNLTNALALREELIERGSIFQSGSDTECIIHLMARSIQKTIPERMKDALRRVEGAFSIVAMTRSKLIGVRDPLGVRPLMLGRLGDAWVLSSETCALDIIGAEFVREVEPGEMVICHRRGRRELLPVPAACSRASASSSTSTSPAPTA